jgi:hypothetical protein
VLGQRCQHQWCEGRHGATPDQAPIAFIEILEDGVHVLGSY